MKTFFSIILLLSAGMAYSQNDYKLISKALKEINSEIDKSNFDKALEVAVMSDSLFKQIEETETIEYAYLKRIIGYIYSEKGEISSAEINYKVALDLYREYSHGADPYFILGLGEYSSLLTKEKRYSEAEPILMEAIELQEDGRGKEGLEYAFTLFNLGSLYYETGRYLEAESILKESLGLRKIKSSEFRESYPALLSLLAEVYNKTENYQASIDLYKSALKDVRKIDEEQNAYFLVGLGAVYMELSQFSSAEPLFKQALQIEKSAGRETSENYAIYLCELATLYRETSQYNKSLSVYKEVLQLQESGGHDDYDSYFELSQLFTLMADYAAAEEMAVKTISMAEMNEKKSYNYLSFLNLIGNLYTLTGNYSKAEKSYLEILEKGKEIYGEQSTDYAISIDNLANLYLVTGKEKLASPLVFQALEIKKKNLGELSIEVAYSLNNLSSISQAEGEFRKAEDYQKQALEIYRKCLGEDNTDYAGSMLSLASIYISSKRYSEAEILVKKSVAVIGKKTGENHPLYASCLDFLAGLCEISGRPDSAELLYLKVNNYRHYQIERNFSYLAEKEKEEFISTFTEDFSKFNAFVYKRKARNPLITGVAYDNQLALKSIVLQSSRALRQAVLNSDDKTLTGLYERMNSTKSLLLEQEKLPPVQQWINTDSLESISVNLEKEMTKRMKDLPAFKSFSVFGKSVVWQDVQNSISDKEAAIEFVSTGEDTILYYALVLRPGMKYPEMVGLFNENDLKGLIDKNRSGKDAAIDRLYRFSQGAGLSGPSKNLYDIIWEPLETYLKGVEKIYYSPAGLLNLISFDAIPCSENSYLSDRYKLVAVTSTREVVNKTDEMFPSAGSMKVVFYGGINYDTDISQLKSQKKILTGEEIPGRTSLRAGDSLRGSGFMFLDGTLSEIQKIEPLMSKKNIPTLVFSGDEATEESFKSLNNLNSPFCLHIATHGFFFSQPKDIPQLQGTRSVASGNIYRSAENPLFRS